jgi:hypothetical protein
MHGITRPPRSPSPAPLVLSPSSDLPFMHLELLPNFRLPLRLEVLPSIPPEPLVTMPSALDMSMAHNSSSDDSSLMVGSFEHCGTGFQAEQTCTEEFNSMFVHSLWQ